jgi:hypothetical protein
VLPLSPPALIDEDVMMEPEGTTVFKLIVAVQEK